MSTTGDDEVNLVRRAVSALNAGDIEGYLSGFAPDCLRWEWSSAHKWIGYGDTDTDSGAVRLRMSADAGEFLFRRPFHLFWSFPQAISKALAILLVHNYFGHFATGAPTGVGAAVGNAVRTSLVVVVSVTLLVSLAVFGVNGNFHHSG